MSAGTLQLAWRPLISARAAVLVALFGLTAVLLVNISVPIEAAPRWPSTVAVDGWNVGAESVDTSRPGVAMVSRTLVHASDAVRATVVITTSPNAKAVFRAGAAVPFLGNGYAVDSAPMVPANGSREAFIARRGDNDAWLQISVYGERRGAFGSGVLGWSLATVDSLLGRGNDYYLARVVVPYSDDSSTATTDAVQLADALFPRLASFYESN